MNSSWIQQIIYAWKNVFNNFRQHIISSLLTIMVIAISLSLPSICYLLWKNSGDAAKQWYPAPNLTVYLNKSLNSDAINNIKTQIDSFDMVDTTTYLSRTEALSEFEEWSGFKDAIELLGENPLPAVIIVYPKNDKTETASLKVLKDYLHTISGVDEVKMDDSWFTRLTALTKMVGKISFAISIMTILAVFLVIGNSVRLNIFARYDTIKVMQLIGATDGFILRPFLYNGGFIGFMGAIFALIITHLFIWQLSMVVANTATILGTDFSFKGMNIDESVLLIFISVILGWISAWIVTSKYLQFMTTK